MIRIFLGEDNEKAKKALDARIQDAKNEAKGGHVNELRFNDVNFDPVMAMEAIYSQDLFGGITIVVFENITESLLYNDFFSNKWNDVSNYIFIRETKANKDLVGWFENMGTIEKFPTVEKKAWGNENFAMAEAVVAREKRHGWALFAMLRRGGASAEELHGTLFWAMKMVACASKLSKDDAIRAGVKPQQYGKYLTYSKKYLPSEIEEKLRTLKNIFHDAHRGEGDLDVLLEEFILQN